MVDGTANQDRFIRRRRFARAFVERALVRRFEYTWDIPEDLPDQFMLLANHGTFLDPVMAYITFPNHPLYFFMGEQVYRTPVLGRVVRYLADPIPVMRQVGDARAVMTVTIGIQSTEHLNSVIARLRKVKDITEIIRS